MLKEIFGKAYGDVVKEDVTYTLSESAKRLLSAVYNKEYIKDGSVAKILDGLGLDDKSRKVLEKKLKGAKYETDVKILCSLAVWMKRRRRRTLIWYPKPSLGRILNVCL